MIRISKQIVRIALLVMLFQFLCPAFISIVVQQIPTSKATSFSIQHTSIVAPMFLKEKEEEEKENFESFGLTNSVALLDLSSHSFNLTASHENTRHLFLSEYSLRQPPLFALFCTFLI